MMVRPAARDALLAVENKRGLVNSHPGLLLQRYLAASAAGDEGSPEEKTNLLLAAIEAAGRQELKQLYKQAFDRWKRSLPPNTRSREFVSAGRIIVGLGSENVLEAGITLHHTYGMPVLPGPALKGLASHYCSQIWGATDGKFRKPTAAENEAYRKWLVGKGPQPADNYHRVIFGTTDEGGCIVFHDGWFIPDSDPRPLKRDVMTPHHLAWQDGSAPPTDFDSPNPVPFLSVSGKFFIALTWDGPRQNAESGAWLELAFDLLTAALKDWGIGAKTSSGYGRLRKV